MVQTATDIDAPTTAAATTTAATTTIPTAARAALSAIAGDPATAHGIHEHLPRAKLPLDAGLETDAAASAIAPRRDGSTAGRYLVATAASDTERPESAAYNQSATESVAETDAQS